jgi:uncharacterized protein DUF4153
MTTERTRLAIYVLGAALLFGVLGDGLLRAMPWGINLPIFMALFLAALLYLARTHGVPLTRETTWLLVPPALFALGYAWRASPALHALDFLGLVTSGCVLFAASQRTALTPAPLRMAGITDYVWGALATARSLITGPFLLAFQDVRWRELPVTNRFRLAGATGTGIAIAAPLILVFGALLMGADAVFENLVNNAFAWDVETLASHAVLFGVFGTIAAGFLHGTLLRQRPAEGPEELGMSRFSLGAIEVGIPLGALNFLFLLFVVIQVRYLFGGEALVQATAGLSYAEYARRGFFELVTVAALSLPILLAAEWLSRNAEPRGRQSVHALAMLQVALLGVMLVSAVVRMRMYWSAYGLTEQRLYAMVFMGWLAVMLAWFAWTVLRGRRNQFAFGALTTGWAVIAALNVLNPDALIVRTNLARLEAGAEFDGKYLAGLSADALPELIQGAAILEQHDLCLPARRGSYGNQFAYPEAGWRSWNWSRSRAVRLLETQRETVGRMDCQAGGRPHTN